MFIKFDSNSSDSILGAIFFFILGVNIKNPKNPNDAVEAFKTCREAAKSLQGDQLREMKKLPYFPVLLGNIPTALYNLTNKSDASKHQPELTALLQSGFVKLYGKLTVAKAEEVLMFFLNPNPDAFIQKLKDAVGVSEDLLTENFVNTLTDLEEQIKVKDNSISVFRQKLDVANERASAYEATIEKLNDFLKEADAKILELQQRITELEITDKVKE